MQTLKTPITRVLNGHIKYATRHTIAWAILTAASMLFPIIVLSFGDYSANFLLFRANVTHRWWWDVACQTWAFATSAIKLIYRVNKVEGGLCGNVPGFISFGSDFSKYAWYLDVYITIIIVVVFAAAMALWLPLFSSVPTEMLASTIKLLHTIGGAFSIILVSITMNASDQLAHEGTNSQDISLGLGFYTIVLMPFIALILDSTYDVTVKKSP